MLLTSPGRETVFPTFVVLAGSTIRAARLIDIVIFVVLAGSTIRAAGLIDIVIFVVLAGSTIRAARLIDIVILSSCCLQPLILIVLEAPTGHTYSLVAF